MRDYPPHVLRLHLVDLWEFLRQKDRPWGMTPRFVPQTLAGPHHYRTRKHHLPSITRELIRHHPARAFRRLTASRGDTFPAVTPPTLSEGSTRAHAILQTSVPSHLRGPDVLEMHPVFSDADATPAWADVPPPSENASPSSSYSDDYKPPSPTADRDGILFYSRAGITQRIAPPQITHTQSDTTLQVKLQSSVPNELRRATSLERLKVLEPLETLHTDLVEHLKIPWSEDFRPGYGVNALTGEFTARSAFKDFKMVESSKLGESHTTVEHLKWQTVKELRDDFEISVGATVNVLCPQVGANAKIATLLSKNTSTSTILVEYRVDANFAVDYIPNVELQEGLDRLSDEEFRAKYGDYYIAGCQKGYSCRMIAECKINEGKVTEGLQREAEAFVKECFTGKLKFDNSESTTKRFSLLSVIVDTEGCLADISNMSSVAVADVPQTLSQLELRKNTPGVPRVAYLYHYSALRSCMLSRRMQVPWAMFDRARVLRGGVCPPSGLSATPCPRRISL
ncbi:FHA domain-containing protein [Mycena venus]|uniref:FHA domain-containing protein n=1 Tax=Mycena venus TaxID=2733690 RepID=A0A8H7CVY4_9AGAR|nr:FHA domain-containing protein [Mycena venus]